MCGGAWEARSEGVRQDDSTPRASPEADPEVWVCMLGLDPIPENSGGRSEAAEGRGVDEQGATATPAAPSP